MKNLSISVNDLSNSDNFQEMIKAMLTKRLDGHTNIKSLYVDLSKSEDTRVPNKVELEATLHNGHLINSSAMSVNHLSAFSQALFRLEKRLAKADSQLRA